MSLVNNNNQNLKIQNENRMENKTKNEMKNKMKIKITPKDNNTKRPFEFELIDTNVVVRIILL